MSISNRDGATSRALSESADSTEYPTPYRLVSATLRPQTSKTRAAVVELIVDSFGLHEFDAETIARSAADLTQLKDAVRNPRRRRYGQLEIEYIEFDVVTWKILPSIENIRFEGERAWKPKEAMRYESLGSGMPVLALRESSKEKVLASLREQTSQIWRQNPHSKTIPLRGIEVPGLLAVTRLSIGDGKVVGLLDATDGFSRTVGAHKGLGIDAEDVLFALTDEALEARLRNDLVALRDSGRGDLDDEAATIIATQLRTSIMPRAQVIVGYKWLDADKSDGNVLRFDHARRALVGHVHLEPAMKFSDSTQFALKAKIALEALNEAGNLPIVDGMTSEEVLGLLTTADGFELETPAGERSALWADEISLVAIEALRNGGGSPDRTRTVNRAISSLTGKVPSKLDRGVLAVDTAMRVTGLANMETGIDPAYIGKRSALGRAWTASGLAKSRFTGASVTALLGSAVRHLREESAALKKSTISAAAAELGALALFDMVIGPREPLLARSSVKNANGAYSPEPQQVIQRLMESESGLHQLAQIIFDVRAQRMPKRLARGDVAEDRVRSDLDEITRENLLQMVDSSWEDDADDETDPARAVESSLLRLAEMVTAMNELQSRIESFKGMDGQVLIERDGANLAGESEKLSSIIYKTQKWTEVAKRREVDAIEELEADADEFDDLEAGPTDLSYL